MNSKRIKVKIKELGKVVGGATPSTRNPENWGGSIPWLTPKDLANHRERFIKKGEKCISQKGYESCSTKMLPKGTVLFSSRAPIGYCAIAENDICTNQGFKSIIPNENTDSLFLYYLLKSNIDAIANHASGTTFPEISGKAMEEIEVLIPEDKNEQKQIARVLNVFDRKIENNLKLNDYLTDLSSAIYNEFINRSSGKWGTLSDIVDLIKEPISSRTRPELPYLPIDVIPMKRIGIEGFRPYEEAKSSLQLFKKDDIVIGAMRVYFHRVILTPCKGMTRNTCFVLRPRNKNLREFALLSCFQNETIEFANLHSKGSTMPYAVWKGSFENCPVFIPNEHDLEVFSIRMSPLIDKIRDIYKENSALINLRNDLLSQLLSGKIDLSKFN